ncbi:hypothetical protein [Methanolapillus ohkumae]|uniref:hypothetical protein n=1 Tax=Methanolapillus ohkumae TaxID=3028298 RepID=UPI0030B8E904
MDNRQLIHYSIFIAIFFFVIVGIGYLGYTEYVSFSDPDSGLDLREDAQVSSFDPARDLFSETDPNTPYVSHLDKYLSFYPNDAADSGSDIATQMGLPEVPVIGPMFSLIYMSTDMMKTEAEIVAEVTVMEKMPARWSTPDNTLPKGISISKYTDENGDEIVDFSTITGPGEFIYWDTVLEVNKIHKGKLDSKDSKGFKDSKYILLRSSGGTVGDFTWWSAENGGPGDYVVGQKYLIYVEEDSWLAPDLGPNHYVLVYPYAKFNADGEGKYTNHVGESVFVRELR